MTKRLSIVLCVSLLIGVWGGVSAAEPSRQSASAGKTTQDAKSAKAVPSHAPATHQAPAAGVTKNMAKATASLNGTGARLKKR